MVTEEIGAYPSGDGEGFGLGVVGAGFDEGAVLPGVGAEDGVFVEVVEVGFLVAVIAGEGLELAVSVDSAVESRGFAGFVVFPCGGEGGSVGVGDTFDHPVTPREGSGYVEYIGNGFKRGCAGNPFFPSDAGLAQIRGKFSFFTRDLAQADVVGRGEAFRHCQLCR